MPTIPTLGRRLAAPLVLLALAGCDPSTTPADTLPRKAIGGTVTLDGQPLARGMIQFDPAPGNQAPTTVAVAEIKEGKFAIDRPMGPVPGKYKVSISSQPPVTIGPGQEPGERPKMDPEKVPPRYNTRSTLEKEVAGDGDNTFDFQLKSG